MKAANNVMRYRQAVKEGVKPWLYSYSREVVPQGWIEVQLDAMIWVGMAMGIGCYFRSQADGRRFLVTVYYDLQQGGYCTKEGGEYVLRYLPQKMYLVEIKRSRSDKPFLAHMVPI